MKTKRGTVTLLLERYRYPRKSAPLDVPAYIVGDVAIHRWQFWHDGEAPELAEDPRRNSWTVSHVPTGSTLARLLPRRLQHGGTTKRELEEWARRVQRACPAFFDVTRKLGPGEYLPADQHNIARDALNKSHAL